VKAFLAQYRPEEINDGVISHTLENTREVLVGFSISLDTLENDIRGRTTITRVEVVEGSRGIIAAVFERFDYQLADTPEGVTAAKKSYVVLCPGDAWDMRFLGGSAQGLAGMRFTVIELSSLQAYPA